MAKCIKCGKSTLVRGHVKLADAAICTPCFKSLGFKLTDTAGAAAYHYSDIMDGKDQVYNNMAKSRTPSNLNEYKIHGISYENEDGHDIQKLLSKFVKDQFEDDKLSASEIKEELQYEDKVYIYPTMDIDVDLIPTTFDGEPAVKVMAETSPYVYEHIGWIPKRQAAEVVDLLNNYQCEMTGELIGGPYKYLDEDDKVASDSTEYGGRVYLSYK